MNDALEQSAYTQLQEIKRWEADLKKAEAAYSEADSACVSLKREYGKTADQHRDYIRAKAYRNTAATAKNAAMKKVRKAIRDDNLTLLGMGGA